MRPDNAASCSSLQYPLSEITCSGSSPASAWICATIGASCRLSSGSFVTSAATNGLFLLVHRDLAIVALLEAVR